MGARLGLLRFYFALLLFALPLTVHAETDRLVAILLDSSKSTPIEQFEATKKTVLAFSETLTTRDVVAVYLFGNTLRKVELKELNAAEPSDSYTKMYDATYDVVRRMVAIPARKKVLLLVTDGQDTGSSTLLEDTTTLANSNQIVIHAVGVGTYNLKQLERLTKLTGGTSFEFDGSSFLQKLNDIVGPPTASVQQEEQPGPDRKAAAANPVIPAKIERKRISVPYWLLGGLGISILFLGFCLYKILNRTVKKVETSCPTCGKPLEDNQIVCTDCSGAPTGRTIRLNSIFNLPEPRLPDEDHHPQTVIAKLPIMERIEGTVTISQIPMLVVQKGKNSGRTIPLAETSFSIGRAKMNELPLDDATISGQHCRIVSENSSHILHDLGSTNGTYVNEMKVNTVVLKSGDIIRIGQTEILFKKG